MADVDIRVPEPDEAEAFLTPIFRGFGEVLTPELLERARLTWEPDRNIGVVDDGRWVAGAGAYTMRLTVPGLGEMPVAGVTDVGVSVTHRRRGLLTALMARQLDDVAVRGEPVAVLIASESVIYSRFGYGPATAVASYEIEPERSQFLSSLVDEGRCRFVAKADALGPLHDAFERCHRNQVGSVSRSEAKWRVTLTDPVAERGGASELFCVVHDGPEGPDGVLLYRINDAWGPETHNLPGAVAVVEDLHGATPEVEAALWRFVLDVDLTARVKVSARPVNEPVQWRLVEPRRLRTTSLTDWLWTRVLDVPAALSARRYAVEGEVVIEVVDRFRPVSGGRFRLVGGPDGAECTPAPDALPDLVVGASELGALYLGRVAPSVLAGAGRIDEQTRGALARADLLFPTTPEPFCGTGF